MDPVTNMIVTDPNLVWSEYVKVHKEAGKLKGHPLLYFNSWVKIFGNDYAQVNEAVDVGNALHELINGGNYKSNKARNEFIVDNGQSSWVQLWDDVYNDADSNAFPTQNEPNTKSTSSGIKRKLLDIGVEVIESMIGKFLENISSTVGALMAGLNMKSKSGSTGEQNESEEYKMLFNAIAKINGLTMEEKLRATHRLALKSQEMDAFWGVP